MDAYDIALKIKQLWIENYDKNSGSIKKSGRDIRVRINGKEITDIKFENGHIELKVENEA